MYTLSEKLGWTTHNSRTSPLSPFFSNRVTRKISVGGQYSHVAPHFKGNLMLITKRYSGMRPK